MPKTNRWSGILDSWKTIYQLDDLCMGNKTLMEKKETFPPLSFACFSQFSHPAPHTRRTLTPLQMAGPDHPASWLISSLQPEQAQVILGHPDLSQHILLYRNRKSWIHCSISALSTGSLLAPHFHFSPFFSLSSQLAFSSPREYMKLALSSWVCPCWAPPLKEVFSRFGGFTPHLVPHSPSFLRQLSSDLRITLRPWTY